MHACQSRLDCLDLHADAFQRAENLGDVVHDSDRGADGHAKEGPDRRAARGGEHIDHCDDGGICDEYDRRIDGIVEISAVHRPVALADDLLIAVPHIGLAAEIVDGPDASDGLRDKIRDARHGCPVVDLRAQHALLNRPRESEDQRQHGEKEQGETTAAQEQDDEDADHLAGIGEHADDTGGEELLHGVHISDETGYCGARVLPHQAVGGEAVELLEQSGAHAVRDFLPQHGEKTLAAGGQHAGQREQGKIFETQCGRDVLILREFIDDPLQNQRREQAHDDGAGDRQNHGGGEQTEPGEGAENDFTHGGRLLSHFHCRKSGSHRASGIPDWTA